MKYIITEDQYKTLQEVGVAKGTFNISPIKYFWTFINSTISEKKRVNAFRNYYTKIIGVDVSNLSFDDILEFYDELDELGTSVLPKKSNVKVSAFNCDYNDKHRDIANNLGINGFPTIRYINKNKKSADYHGGIDIENILKFLIEKS